MDIAKFITSYPLISDQIEPAELNVLLIELNRVLEQAVPGDIVEFGCYVGTSSLFLQRLLAGRRTFHVYDSFEGLPPKGRFDESPIGSQFEAGKLHASKADFIKHFKKARLPLPRIHKAWFKDLEAGDLPEQIAFAFLDGDYYDSILTPLKLIWPRLSPGAVVMVDDYQNEALPGAAKAVDEWLKAHPVAVFQVQASLAVMILSAG